MKHNVSGKRWKCVLLWMLPFVSLGNALLRPTDYNRNESMSSFCGRYYVSVPIAVQDWQGLASLLVDSFDENRSAPWWQQPLLRTNIYRHYVQTARRLRGKKYAIHLAKDAISGQVIGIAEVGRSAIASSKQVDPSSRDTKVVTTVGVLAVHPQARRYGIARRLLEQCLETATLWESSHLFVEVEPTNHVMMACLDSLSFSRVSDALINVPVMRRGTEKELRPHVVYRREVPSPESKGD